MGIFSRRRPAELRDGSYTDEVIGRILAAAKAGGDLATDGLGALEGCAMFYAGVLVGATVTPAGSRADLLTASIRRQIGRQLIRQGESVWIIDVVGQGLDVRVRLLPAASWQITGNADPSSWTYRAELAAPDGMVARTVPYDQVLHYRWSTDPLQPWRGVSPLEAAHRSGQLQANIETRLGQETGGISAYLLAVPLDGQAPGLETLRQDIRNAEGGTVLTETTATLWDQDSRRQRNSREFMPARIGANPPRSLVDLHQAIADSVMAACGLSPDLVARRGDGAAAREAYRRVYGTALRPVCDLVAEETSTKLDVAGVALDISGLHAHDIRVRSASYAELVATDTYSTDQAAKLAGLDPPRG